MTNAPHTNVIADQLDTLAALLRKKGPHATDMAALINDRGYPAGGNGGGGRSSDTTSSTERAALNEHTDQLTRTAGDWLPDLRQLWYLATRVSNNTTQLCAHASDHDPIPVGRGECQACSRFCKGDGNNDRLRAGFCNNCTQRWRRYRVAYPNATRSDFVTDTKREQRQLGVTT